MYLDESKPIIIAHRGAKYYEPENTIRAILRAIELGADVVEIDVRMCKDGIPVVIHDANLKRLTGVDKLVKDLTIHELRNLKVFGKEPIPTLEDVLRTIRDRIPLIIEVKEPGIEDKVVKLIEKYGLVNNVMIVSFYDQILHRVKKLNKLLKIGLITSKFPIPLDILKDLEAHALFPRINLVGHEYVQILHRHRYKVYPWVINDLYTACQIIDFGADGFATDKPDLKKYLKYLGRLRY